MVISSRKFSLPFLKEHTFDQWNELKEKIEKVAVAYYFQFIESDSVFITVAVIVMVCSCEYVVVTSRVRV